MAELLAELTTSTEPESKDWESMRNAGRGPWAPDVLAEDARRLRDYQRSGEGVPWPEVEAWVESWGTPAERAVPRPRKL